MSFIKLGPEKIIERFQAGEWDDHPLYWPAYQKYILQKQSSVFRLAEDLRMFRMSDTPYDRPNKPGLKTRIATFEKEHLQALHSDDTAYARRLLRATQLLRKGDPKWRFTLHGLIVLAIIDLRENHHRQPIKKAQLRNLIMDWRRANGQAIVADSQWYRGLKQPEIVALLVVH